MTPPSSTQNSPNDPYNVQARTAAVETDVQSIKGHVNSLDNRLGQVEKALTVGFDEVKPLVLLGKAVAWPRVLATVGLVLSVGVFLRTEFTEHTRQEHSTTQQKVTSLERDMKWLLKLLDAPIHHRSP